MGRINPMQMCVVGFIIFLFGFPLAKSSTNITSTKEEIKCNCEPAYVYPSPPPPVVDCPPPPIPPSPPIPPPPPPPPRTSPPPPRPPCIICICIKCPPLCPGCPQPPCDVCQVPIMPSPPTERGELYPPEKDLYGIATDHSAASSIHLQLKLVVSIIFLVLSVTYSFF